MLCVPLFVPVVWWDSLCARFACMLHINVVSVHMSRSLDLLPLDFPVCVCVSCATGVEHNFVTVHKFNGDKVTAQNDCNEETNESCQFAIVAINLGESDAIALMSRTIAIVPLMLCTPHKYHFVCIECIGIMSVVCEKFSGSRSSSLIRIKTVCLWSIRARTLIWARLKRKRKHCPEWVFL